MPGLCLFTPAQEGERHGRLRAHSHGHRLFRHLGLGDGRRLRQARRPRLPGVRRRADHGPRSSRGPRHARSPRLPRSAVRLPRRDHPALQDGPRRARGNHSAAVRPQTPTRRSARLWRVTDELPLPPAPASPVAPASAKCSECWLEVRCGRSATVLQALFDRAALRGAKDR